MKNMKKNILIVVVIVIISGVSFYGGMKYSQSQTTNQIQNRQFGTGNFNAGQRGTARNGASGFSSGEIISKDDKSMTIKLKDGGSKIIFFSSSTPIIKDTEGSINDLNIGEQITANGTANQDGSISAQSIQIRPVLPQKQD